MKTIILTAALSLLACAAQAQETPPAPAPETIKKAHPAAWLGIAMGDTDGKVVVSEIAPDSPAAKAGLQKGDVIVRVGDAAIEGKMERVVKSVAEKQPGDAIEIHWQRGKEGATRVELAARPAPAEKDFRGEFSREEDPTEADASVKKLKDGAEQSFKKAAEAARDALEKTHENLERLQEKKKELVERQKADKARDQPAAFLGIAVEPGPDGMLAVSSVVPDSPAAKAGLKGGDFLLSIDGEPIKGDVQRFVKNVGGKKPGEVIDLRWQRGDKEETSRIELAKRTLERDTRKSAEEFRSKVERSKDELERGLGKLRLDSDADSADTDKMLRFYLDKEWPGDKAGDKNWKLRFREELPHFERKFPGGANELKGFHRKLDTKEKQSNDDAIWKRVQQSVAGALEKSGVGPDVSERVMQAVEDARRAGSEKQERRAKLEAEAAKLEKEMQGLKERADKLRDELKKSAE